MKRRTFLTTLGAALMVPVVGRAAPKTSYSWKDSKKTYEFAYQWTGFTYEGKPIVHDPYVMHVYGEPQIGQTRFENSPIRITSGTAASSELEMDEGYLGIGQKTAIMCEPKSVVHDILRSLNGKMIDLWATVVS